MTRIAFLIITVLLALTNCSKTPPARGVDDGTVERYEFTGTVVRLDEANRIATIKHGQIANATGKVWMEPMTMEFPVLEAAEFAKLKAGDSIRATVHARQSDLDYWITGIRAAGVGE